MSDKAETIYNLKKNFIKRNSVAFIINQRTWTQMEGGVGLFELTNWDWMDGLGRNGWKPRGSTNSPKIHHNPCNSGSYSFYTWNIQLPFCNG